MPYFRVHIEVHCLVLASLSDSFNMIISSRVSSVAEGIVHFVLWLRNVFAGKDGEALYSQQTQDQELTVAQIMNSLLPNSDLN